MPLPCPVCEGPTIIHKSIYKDSIRKTSNLIPVKDGFHLHHCLECLKNFTTCEIAMDASGEVFKNILKEGKG